MSWQVYALASASFAALTAIFGKIGVTTINSDLATLFRTVIIFLVTALIITLRGEWQPWSTFDRRTVIFLTLSGLATGASWLCYYRALQLGPASQVAPVEKISVAITIIMALIFLGEPISIKVLSGGALVVAGVLVIAL